MINVGQRSSLYMTIGRLNESGLIAVRQTERDQQSAERPVYELTPEGRDYALSSRWPRCSRTSATSSRRSSALRERGRSQMAITEAELRWVQQITDVLASGSLIRSNEDSAGAEEAYLPDA